jgi:hypothetical protein
MSFHILIFNREVQHTILSRGYYQKCTLGYNRKYANKNIKLKKLLSTLPAGEDYSFIRNEEEQDNKVMLENCPTYYKTI